MAEVRVLTLGAFDLYGRPPKLDAVMVREHVGRVPTRPGASPTTFRKITSSVACLP